MFERSLSEEQLNGIAGEDAFVRERAKMEQGINELEAAWKMLKGSV